MNDQINITYTPATGDIEFTTARKTNSLDEAVAAIGDFIRTLKGEPVKQVKTATEEVNREQPKPKAETAEVIRPKTVKPKAERTKRSRHMWTDEEKMLAIKMYQRGEPLERIASRFSSTTQSVQKIMAKNGIRRPWPTKGNPSQLKADEPKEEPV